MCFDEQDQNNFLYMIESRYKQIHHNDFPKPISNDRSNFKCTKLCHFYKNNWPGTNKPMCNYVEDHLRAFGYDETIEKCTNDNFDIGYYSAPG
jgi:hypothetical protein